MADDLKYSLRGVSASKEDVHAAIKNIDKGLFPRAFCKIVPDRKLENAVIRKACWNFGR